MSIVNMTDFEKYLFHFVLRRKFVLKNPQFKETDFYSPSISQIQELLRSYMPKKTEECYKFILARSLQRIKTGLEKKANRKMSLDCFYETYFEETSKKYSIPVKDFQYPLTKDLKGKINLNYQYFCKLFKSENLLQDIKIFFENEIIHLHNKEINKKLNSLILKWEKLYLKWELLRNCSQEKVLEQISSHKRYKIPWTIVEVKEGISKFNKLVLICKEKSSKEKDKVPL